MPRKKLDAAGDLADELGGALLEAAPDAIVIVGGDGRIVLANGQAEALFGYGREELLGQPAELLIPARFHERHGGHRAGYAADPRTRPMGSGLELYARRKDGSEFPVEISLSTLRSRAGPLVLSAIRDVSQRRRREQLLREQEAALRRQAQLLELAHDAIMVRDLDGTILSWNRGAEELYGWTHDEVAGRITHELLATRFPVSLEAQDDALREMGRWDGELAHVRRGGARVLVESRQVLVRDDSGVPAAILEINRDVTDRQRAEAERARLLDESRRLQARFRGLFDGAADALLVVDAEGRLLEVNPAALRLLGYAESELLGMGLADIVVGGEAWLAVEFAQLRREHGWQGEHEVRRRDGHVVPVESRATAVELPDGVAYRLALRDISERRALQQLQREFVAMVSHELMNPVTGIGLHAELLQMTETYSEPAVAGIMASARRLERLVGDLLDASRLETGRLRLQPRRTDLGALARVAADVAQLTSRAHTIRLEIPEAPLVGEWDPGRLEQVLHNLLSNAIKYAPGGEIVVRVERVESEARVEVSDGGPGMLPELLPRVFERFYRARDAERTAQGLGLGLYITRSLVEAHGGRIWVESEPGQGATFSFVLPLRDGDPG